MLFRSKCGPGDHNTNNCQKTRCYNCGDYGHLSNACNKPSVCWICKQPDHVSGNCPNKMDKAYNSFGSPIEVIGLVMVVMVALVGLIDLATIIIVVHLGQEEGLIIIVVVEVIEMVAIIGPIHRVIVLSVITSLGLDILTSGILALDDMMSTVTRETLGKCK